MYSGANKNTKAEVGGDQAVSIEMDEPGISPPETGSKSAMPVISEIDLVGDMGPEGDAFDDGGIPDSPFGFHGDFSDIIGNPTDDDKEDFLHDDEKERPPSIREGGFALPFQEYVFTRLRLHIRQACNVNSSKALRARALRWVFVPGEEDAMKIAFAVACQALGARPIVVQARAMHQLWRGGIVLMEPLPFATSLPPRSIISEISAIVGPGIAEDIAKEAWYWPSMPVAALRKKFVDVPEHKLRAAIDDLTANGYLAVEATRLYFITRNPLIMSKGQRNGFSFSASIHSE